MIYFIDTSVFIKAKNFYYQMDRVPEFWSWLEFMGTKGVIKIPKEIYDELARGNDNLSKWIKERKGIFYINEEITPDDIGYVLKYGYKVDPENLSEEELEKIKGDPFLIVYAWHNKVERTIVSAEDSAPSKTGLKRRIPDVCRELGVEHRDTFQLISELDFRTNWNR